MRMKRFLGSIVVFVMISVVSQTALAQSFNFVSIDVPPFKAGTELYGINNWRQIVGILREPIHPNRPHSFVRVGALFYPIEFPGSRSTTVNQINNSGQIVGQWFDGNAYHGFLLSTGKFLTIDFPGGPQYTALSSINDRFEILGGYSFQYPANSAFHSFLLTKGSFNTDLGGVGINNWGQIVGSERPSLTEGVRGYILTDGQREILHFPGSRDTYANAINNLGQVVGTYYDPVPPFSEEPKPHGFLFSEGQYTSIDFPGGNVFQTFATGINDWGEIVGYYLDGKGQHGFLATPIR